MSEKYQKTCKYLNYFEHLIILASTSTSCASVSAFFSLACVPVGITSSAVGMKICGITAEIKKCKSIITKKKKHDKIVLLGKRQVKQIIDSYISHEEFVSANNVLREYNEMKREIKNPENSMEYTI